jgi:hypothetical protein
MDSYTILLGMPGPHIRFNTAQSCFFSVGKQHKVLVVGADNASWDNMNLLWSRALNAAMRDGITHFAMIHADIEPDLKQDWVQILLEEMEAKGCSFISGTVPIKDGRGVMSCGIGDPRNPWVPHRRFTVRETLQMPETFTAGEIGYTGWPLNHNSGLILADLRNPKFFEADDNGDLRIWFEFRKRMHFDADGNVKLSGESEDWNISRRLWQCGVKTCMTRKVRLRHFGSTGYPNFRAWGDYEHDPATRSKWAEGEAEMVLLEPENAIRGWLADEEKRELQRLAHGENVVEFGSYCGKSTVAMARFASHVTAVDTFQGVPAGSRPDSGGKVTVNSRGELLREFTENIYRCKVADKITTLVEPAEVAIGAICFKDTGLVFFDADHSFQSTYQCGAQLFRRIPPTCTLAFHDYSDGDPGVKQAVDLLSLENKRTFRTVETLAIFDRQT